VLPRMIWRAEFQARPGYGLDGSGSADGMKTGVSRSGEANELGAASAGSDSARMRRLEAPVDFTVAELAALTPVVSLRSVSGAARR